MSDTRVIAVKNVRKSYGGFLAVNGLSFDVDKTECFGLLGPNGAGKTTMMKMIYGMAIRDPHSDGSISVFGYDPLYDELKIKNLCGVVPQEDNLDIELNVVENLDVFCRFYGMSKSATRDRIDYLLDLMELTDKRDSKIKALSGGMKRRLIIARALVNQPKLLILDEPTTGLDPQVRHVIWNKLRAMKKLDMTILLTTHYMEEAFQLCDRLIIMDGGKKMMEGNPQRLLKDNMEHYVLELKSAGSFGKVEGFLKETAANIGSTTEAATKEGVTDKAGNDEGAFGEAVNAETETDETETIEAETDEAASKKAVIRVEHMEEIVYVYSNDPEVLQKAVCLLKGEDYYLRQSNLEDLFLKTTGRALANAQ
ncbi:MAG: ABC transporter ATP-binding protein [Nitrospirae bacterium]|nr:ABC transporter ATP-binding protein [Nitrospirota bacterium]